MEGEEFSTCGVQCGLTLHLTLKGKVQIGYRHRSSEQSIL